MAVNESRNLNAELAEGLTDGVVKKLAPNRGALTDAQAAETVYNNLARDLYDPTFTTGESVARRQTTLRG